MNERILLVDDHEVVRKGIKSVLNGHFSICGEASNGEEAIAKTIEMKPDLVILDISMPGANGFEIAAEIRRDFPSVKIIILSQHDRERLLPRALEAGADACLDKNCLGTELLPTIHGVMGNAHALGAEVTE